VNVDINEVASGLQDARDLLSEANELIEKLQAEVGSLDAATYVPDGVFMGEGGQLGPDVIEMINGATDEEPIHLLIGATRIAGIVPKAKA
jgi:hypothetical protein